MSGTRRGLMLLAVLVAMMAGWASTATAQVTTTTVQDTVYGANGTAATGTVLVSWSAFTTAGGQSVPAGTTSVAIGTGGSLTVALAPNAGSTPMGTYYTAVFHLSDGTSSRQYWVIPATVAGGATTVTLAEIKSEVLPISVAMQTVSKEYVDDAIAAASTGFPLDSSPYVLTAGDAMSGPLTLPADPVNTNQAADKHYVDTNVAAAQAGLAQKVSLVPTATQTVAQPSGTSFVVAGTNATTTFAGGGAGIGTSTSMIYTTPVATPQMYSNTLQLMGQGYDLGNNGTSAEGWTSAKLQYDDFASGVRGIMQAHGTTFTHSGQGDTAVSYDYLDAYGGAVASGDEAVEDTVHQVHQLGYFTGTVATGGTTGSNLLTTSSFACHGYCITQANDGFQFPDGGMMLDTSKGGATATIASYTHDTTNHAMSYTLASGTVAVSTAWGSIVQSSCSPNGNGQNQVYTSTTCNITLGTSPASPGSFVAGTDMCLAGPFQEEAAVTAVGAVSGGVQSVTFSTRYAWNWFQPAFAMQGGLCGQAFVATSTASSWPVAYQALGATSATTLYFSNCVVGACEDSGSTGNIINPSVVCSPYGQTLTRSGNVVTETSGAQACYYPVGSQIVISGATPSDFDGTFTVVSNNYNGGGTPSSWAMTWAQTGSNETSTSFTSAPAPPSITFYPMAFITGTNGGVEGDALLATNTVNWTAGDSVTGAPSSEYAAIGEYIVKGQATPVDYSLGSSGLYLQDDGPVAMADAIRIANNSGSPSGEGDIGNDVLNAQGAYNNVFSLSYRPANNGSIIYEAGGEPVSSTLKPYNLFEDNRWGTIQIDAVNYLLRVSQGIVAPSFTDSTVSSAGCATFSAGGVLSSTGTACGSGSGGGAILPATSGLVYSTSTTAATTATSAQVQAAIGSGVYDASGAAATAQTNAEAFSANAGNLSGGTVPAARLPQASSSAAGAVECGSGTTCTAGVISVSGSGTPPLSYEYFRAGVSDGGAAFAGAFTRYDNNQPQAGSVAPATSALGYLLFNASPSAPQYAEVTITLPPYWTSSGLYLQFYSSSTSGNAVLDVQTACVTPGQVVGSPTFTSATTSTAAVSSTADGLVQTALISGIAAPGANGCPATGMTTPTMLTIRVYADATDTVPVYFTGATLVTGRSQ